MVSILFIKLVKSATNMLFDSRSDVFIDQLDLFNHELFILLYLLGVLVNDRTQCLPDFRELNLQLSFYIVLHI